MTPSATWRRTLFPLLIAAALSLAAVAPAPDLDASALRLLALLGAMGIVVASILLHLQATETDRQVAAASELIRRALEGEVHRFLPVARDSPFAALADGVNQLVDGLRSRHLRSEADRVTEEAMVRESPNGLLVTDAQGRVRRFNPALGRLLPFWGDPVGKPPIEGIPVPELQEVIDETRRTRAPSERVATVGRHEVLIRGVPLADGASCMGVVLDISSVRAAERARRDFVANVSHELRTPITAVVGYAESLLQDREELPPFAQPMLEAIDRNARRLAALIEDVLHLSRIEARQGDLVLVPESLRPLVRDVVARFLDRARQKGVILQFADGPEVEAPINIEAFEHALGNLVDNAVKYTPGGGRITVTVEQRGGSAWVSVADTGIGVASAHQERIFERFYRVDPGRSREVGGTGLGLALVKHLCLAMQAEVSLTSAPGAGSTFTLRLPPPGAGA